MIDIDTAIKRDLFTLFYQPKIDIKTNKIIGAEALIRLKDKDRYISPSYFIPRAEKSGEIINIDKWVFKKIIEDSRAIFVKTNENLLLSFNISAKHFAEKTFIKNLENIFNSTKDFLSLFEIEITESTLLKDIKKAKKDLIYLKKIGFKLSIDDFGVGYGPLTYLKDLPIDILKIDKTLIDDIETDEKSLAIVDSILYLCKKLHIKSVAEGVENVEQIDILKDMGCDIIQGYFYAKPLQLDKFIIFVNSLNDTQTTRFIKYSDKYAIGNYAIDIQHMIIINLLNKLFDILRDKKERENFPLKYFTEILDEYILNHFKIEEAIMKKYNYPFLQKHIKEHQNFYTKYSTFKENLTNINERNLYNFFNILKKWFSKHEITNDKKMIDYIKNNDI